MSFDARGAARITFVAALAAECTSLKRQIARGAPWCVLQCGPGPLRAAIAAEQAVADGALLLVSWGLAGGLVAAATPGCVVAPRRIVNARGVVVGAARAWSTALGRVATLIEGDLVSVEHALESSAEKRAAAAGSGAVAVDMESAAIATVAARAKVPFAALRVVVDGVDDALPPGAGDWIDARGRTRFAPVLGALARPSRWASLVMLGRRYAVATRTLTQVAEAIAQGAMRVREPWASSETEA